LAVTGHEMVEGISTCRLIEGLCPLWE
jgi:hypothetical protein